MDVLRVCGGGISEDGEWLLVERLRVAGARGGGAVCDAVDHCVDGGGRGKGTQGARGGAVGEGRAGDTASASCDTRGGRGGKGGGASPSYAQGCPVAVTSTVPMAVGVVMVVTGTCSPPRSLSVCPLV